MRAKSMKMLAVVVIAVVLGCARIQRLVTDDGPPPRQTNSPGRPVAFPPVPPVPPMPWCPTDSDLSDARVAKDAGMEALKAARDPDALGAADAYHNAATQRLRALERRVTDCKYAKDDADRSAREAIRQQAKREEKERHDKQVAYEVTLLSNPKTPPLLYSVGICLLKEEEQSALAAIREEQANSRIGGVVDLLAIKRHQDDVVSARKQQQVYIDELSGLKAKPLPCSHATVKQLIDCMYAAAPEGCNDDLPRTLLILRRRMAPTTDEMGIRRGR